MAALNVVQMVLCMIAAFGMTTNDSLLQDTYWVTGEAIALQSGNNISMDAPLEFFVGVNMYLVRVDCDEAGNSTECTRWYQSPGNLFEKDGNVYKQHVLWRDSDACQLYDSSVKNAVESVGQNLKKMSDACEDCADAMFTNFALVMGILTQIPTITTNLQRSTPFGDLNCQASWGTITCAFGTLTSLIALLAFTQACYVKLPDKINNTTMTWRLGYPYLCLILGTSIKIPDGICHLLLSTPEKRWVASTEKLTSLPDYMSLNATPKQQVMETEETSTSSQNGKEALQPTSSQNGKEASQPTDE